MLLFAAHDPGNKNKIRPVYEHALSLGHEAQFLDLAINRGPMEFANARKLIEGKETTAAILGSSSNQGEWPLIRAFKEIGVPTGMVVDIGTLSKIDSMTPEDFPCRFMVSNKGCYEEVIRLGADPASVGVTGDCHLEVLSNLVEPDESETVREYYGLAGDASVISFFGSPITQDTVDAVVSLAESLSKIDLDLPSVIVRPHPRTRHMEVLELICQPLPFIHFYGDSTISNRALLAASLFSLSMASTVTLESLVLGTPSAFFQVGWDFNDLNQLYLNLVDVQRIRTDEQMHEFVASVARKDGSALTGNVENHRGALARTWKVVEELMAG